MRSQRTVTWRACALIGAALCLAAAARADTDALLKRLAPRGFVNDYAGVLSRREAGSLESTLRGVKAATGAELVLVTLPSLEGGAIDDVAVRLYERWGIGVKGRDNGALLLAAMDDRRVRIEVGYGLEGVLTDGGAGRILDRAVLPAFREGRYAEGLTGGMQALVAAVAGEEAALPAQAAKPSRRPSRGLSLLHILLLIILVPVFLRNPWLFLLLLSGGRGGYGGGGGFSGGFGGFGGGLSGGGGASRGW